MNIELNRSIKCQKTHSARTFQLPSLTIITIFFLIALGGRFPLNKLEIEIFGLSTIQTIGCICIIVYAYFWQICKNTKITDKTWPSSLLTFIVLIGIQIISAFWTPEDARLEKILWDLVTLLFLVIASAMLARDNPDRVARTLLILVFIAAIIYAIAGIKAGAQDQGRYSAFGGGPNVFVRVISMGMIAATALSVIFRQWYTLIPIPLLLSAAVLSGSRGGLISFIIVSFGFFLLSFRRLRPLALISIIIMGALTSWLIWNTIDEIASELSGERYSIKNLEENEFSSRPKLLLKAWSLFLERPFVGGGIDSFYANYGKYIEIGYPHNYIAALACEGGLLALGVFVITIFRWWHDINPRNLSKEKAACIAIAAYIAIASMFSGDYYDTRFMWIFAIIAISENKKKTIQSAEKSSFLKIEKIPSNCVETKRAYRTLV